MPGEAEGTLCPTKGSGVREDRAPGQARSGSWSRGHGSGTVPMSDGEVGPWVGAWLLVPLPDFGV